MSDCNHPKLKCMICHRDLTTKDLKSPVHMAVDGQWLEDEDTLVQMIELFFNNNGILDAEIAEKLGTIITNKQTEHPAFEDIPIEAYDEFDDYIPF